MHRCKYVLMLVVCGLGVGAGGMAQIVSNGASGGGNPTGAAFPANAKTSTYQAIASDFAVCKSIPVASGTFTVTLVASTSQPASGQCVLVLNYGTGTVTVARSGQNINGAAADITLSAGSSTAPSSALIISDGTNYVARDMGASFTNLSIGGISLVSVFGGGMLSVGGSGNVGIAANEVRLGSNAGFRVKPSASGIKIGDNNSPSGDVALTFGDETTSYPALFRSGTQLRVRLADNSADTDFKLRHLVSGGTAPTITSGFGTTPAIAGADGAGRLTVGTGGTATTGVITFGTAFTTAPACVANNETTIALVQAVASTTTLTLNASAAFSAGALLTWHCIGY